MTSTAIARIDDTAPLAIQPGQEMWTGKQRAALAVLGIKDASNAELAVFMHYCQKTQLDPFSRQIYYIKRREKVGNDWSDKWTIQVGIDGFRVMRDRVAARTRCAAEFEDTTWYDADGCAYKVWLSPEPPAACQVVLIKHDYETGRSLRFPAVLRTASYMQVNKDGQPVSQWKTQPDHMIEKCCEAFATRRAFPNDFSGIYLEEELQGRAAAEAVPPAPVRRVTAGDIIVSRQGAREMADRMGPSQDEDAEIVPDPEPQRTVTAQEVNDHFKALGYTARDQKEVLHAAGVLAGRKLPLAAIADLTGDQLAAVAATLEGCGSRGDVVALLAEASGNAAAERAFTAGEDE